MPDIDGHHAIKRHEIIAGYHSKASKKLSCPAFCRTDNLIYMKVSCKRKTMAKNEYSKYQKEVISGYYDNLDTIMLQKLSELVTELYLADTQAKQDRLWQRAYKAMVKLKVPPAIIEHIMGKKDVEILAKNLQDWLNRSRKK